MKHLILWTMDETKHVIQFVTQNHEHMCVFNVAPIWETLNFEKLSQSHVSSKCLWNLFGYVVQVISWEF